MQSKIVCLNSYTDLVDTNEIISFSEVIKNIQSAEFISLDAETTGLYPYCGDHIFSASICDGSNGYYFAFNEMFDECKYDHLGNRVPEPFRLNSVELYVLLETLFINKTKIFFVNAKFDLHHLLKFKHSSLDKMEIYDVQVMARLFDNSLPSYSLANLSKKYTRSTQKLDIVEKYISKHKLFELVDNGKKKREKNKHYYKVPFEIISEYAIVDAVATYKIGMNLLKMLANQHSEQLAMNKKGNEQLLENEMEITKVFLRMEQRGICIDREYTQKAFDHTLQLLENRKQDFKSITGLEYQDAPTIFKQAFSNVGIEPNTTEKGNPSFSDENLPDHEISTIIRDCRSYYKLAFTYYKNLLDLADENNAIHPNFRQSGTKTGRVSCSNPNLQNIPKRSDDNNSYPVRSCFIPRKGFFFVMIDADQGEYRLLLDCAGEQGLIDKINNEGLDVHQATSNELDVPRSKAKTLNFGLLYGIGKSSLAKQLNVSANQAQEYISKYFIKLKKVERFITKMKQIARSRGWIINLMGRRLQNKKDDEYKICNHYIQGSLGDIVKIAMINCDNYLKDKKSNMLLNIHDEILFEIHNSEKDIVKNLIECCNIAYNYKELPLTWGCDYSTTNWHDKKEWNDEMD